MWNISIKTLLLILFITPLGINATGKNSLHRIIITSDGEIDDKSSFIRYLMYCNHFKTEGLIYTNSKWQKYGHGTTWMQDYIDIWNKYRKNITKHESNFPTAKELKSVIFAGNMDVKYLNYTGPLESDGANHIIKVLLDKNPKPVWIQAWGGTNTIAQALSILKRDYSSYEINKALSKIRIYAIDDQDETGKWIRNEFPQIMYIRSWQFTALNYQHAGHPFSNDEIFSKEWINKNVKNEHGDLGKSYPQSYFSEGDSPAFFYFINNGLCSLDNPEYGSWGGRFIKRENNFYTDAVDDGDRLHGQWIWLKDIQNDFAARMDWCVMPYSKANHHPIISRKIPSYISAKPGEIIRLDAKGCKDPDGDELSFLWKHYNYAGCSPYEKKINIKDNDNRHAEILIPNDASGKEIHVILLVRDNGLPTLTSYKRIIISVQ